MSPTITTLTTAPPWARTAWAEHVTQLLTKLRETGKLPAHVCRCCHVVWPTVEARRTCEQHRLSDGHSDTASTLGPSPYVSKAPDDLLTPPANWAAHGALTGCWEWADTFTYCPLCQQQELPANTLRNHLQHCATHTEELIYA